MKRDNPNAYDHKSYQSKCNRHGLLILAFVWVWSLHLGTGWSFAKSAFFAFCVAPVVLMLAWIVLYAVLHVPEGVFKLVDWFNCE